MKKIIVLSLLTIMLTGCVKQADYDNLVKENAKLESKVESLEEENDELKDEIKKLKETPTPTTPDNDSNVETTDTDNKFTTDDTTDGVKLFSKIYNDSKTGEAISVSVTLKDDNSKLLSLTYLPSDFDSEYPSLYENKCAAFLGMAFNLKEGNQLSILIVDSYSYCSLMYMFNDGLSVLSSHDRDDTFHLNTSDGKVGDWLQEKFDSNEQPIETSSVIWMADTITQIQKDIKGIYP